MSPEKKPLRALCTEPANFSEAGLEAIRSIAELDLGTTHRSELIERIGDYDLLFVRLRTFVDGGVIAKADRLKAIVTPTTGLNHIDMDAAAERGIEVFHLRGQVDFLRTITSTAEHTWALLLSLLRNIPEAAADVLDGHWRQDVHRGRELRGKRLGILGLGRLGSIVARYGDAFGMSVAAFDTSETTASAEAQKLGFVTMHHSMGSLMETSDVLSIHIPLNLQTEKLVGGHELSRLPEGAFVVNTSRGEIIDEQALLDGLTSGHIAGAAVDVVAEENAIGRNPLIAYAREHSNLLITPHIGGATFEAVERTDKFVVDRLERWLNP